MILVQRPAALLRVVTVTRQIPEDHLQPLLVVAHLSERQRRALVLRRQRVSARRQPSRDEPSDTHLTLHQRQQHLLQLRPRLRQRALQVSHHHAHGNPRQLVTKVRVFAHQFDQFRSDRRGNGCRLGGATKGAERNRGRGQWPLRVRLAFGSRL